MQLHRRRRLIGPIAIALLAAAAVGATTAPTSADEWVIRVSQESYPGAGDWDNYVIGFVKPFETVLTSAEFYGHDGSSYGGSYITLDVKRDRTHVLFALCGEERMTAIFIHDAPGDSDGGIAEMMFEYLGDEDGGAWGFRDEQGGAGPGGNPDEYSGDTGDFVFTSAQSWGRCCTDGLGLCDIDGMLRVQFTNVDGDPDTETVAGLDQWIVYSLDGTMYPLVIEEDRRVLFEVLPTCATDVNDDGFVDVSDLLILLSTWGECLWPK